MKRYLFLLSILCFMLSCTEKVYEGDTPPPPTPNLRVWPMDVAVSDEVLPMQYVFVKEENLTGVPSQEIPVIYFCGVEVSEIFDKEGELIIQSSKIVYFYYFSIDFLLFFIFLEGIVIFFIVLYDFC